MKMSTEILNQLKAQTALLAQVKTALDALAAAQAPQSPNYRRSLADYPGFDWQALGVTVVQADTAGATEVEWNRRRFIRRSGAGKFGQAIWFSRATGSDDAGSAQYARLITFKDSEAEALQVQVPAQPRPAPAQPAPAPARQQPPANAQPAPAPAQIAPPDLPRPAPARRQPQAKQDTAEIWAALLAQARQVTDPPGFYKIVNGLLAIGKAGHETVSRIVQSKEYATWQDKALALMAA
jgi:hypothetical protein